MIKIIKTSLIITTYIVTCIGFSKNTLYYINQKPHVKSKKELQTIWENYVKATDNEATLLKKELKIDEKDLLGFQIDLDNDGILDWLLSSKNFYFCGYKGNCTTYFFPSTLKGKSIEMCFSPNVNDQIQMSDNVTNGLNDLIIENGQRIMKFDGKSYYCDL